MNSAAVVPIHRQSIGEEVVQTVNARELHEFLEVGKDFSTWIKVQIERARLVENRDYVTVTSPPKGGAAGNRGVRIEYHLTISSAKHIGMMSGTDKGFEVRDYFIECERVAKHATTDPMQALNDPATMRGLLLSYSEKVIALENKNAELTPKAEALDRIANSEGSVCVTNAAKDLQVRPKHLFAYLFQNKWIYRRQGGSGWVAYQDKLQQGLLEHKVTVVTRGDGTEKLTEQVLVTSKGMARLADILNSVPLRLVAGGAR